MKKLLLTALVLTACSRAVSVGTDTAPGATANLKDANGKSVGVAKFWQDKKGVVVDVAVSSLAAGSHGIHIHTVGNCAPANGFTAAGGHFNPDAKKHGLHNVAGPHAGDLPNLVINADGAGVLHFTNEHTTLNALLDADGSALVIHAGQDDQMTDPAGNSGARVACGVITK